MSGLALINELLQSFQVLVSAFFAFPLAYGVSVGAFLIALAVLSLFIRIILGGMKRG